MTHYGGHTGLGFMLSDHGKKWCGLFNQMGLDQKQWQQLFGVWLSGTGDSPSMEGSVDQLVQNSRPQYGG